MKKPNKRGAAPAKQPTKCPVLPIALRTNELWDAHSMAQELEAENKQDEVSEDIEKLRIAMEGMASFERAKSMSGALFQIVLARDAARLLYENVPAAAEKGRYIENIYDQIMRLLESVALLLREKTAPEEFLPLQNVVRLYLDVDGDNMVRPFKWLDDIPGLAKDYRNVKTV
jgi:hypothetical protein